MRDRLDAKRAERLVEAAIDLTPPPTPAQETEPEGGNVERARKKASVQDWLPAKH